MIHKGSIKPIAQKAFKKMREHLASDKADAKFKILDFWGKQIFAKIEDFWGKNFLWSEKDDLQAK